MTRPWKPASAVVEERGSKSRELGRPPPQKGLSVYSATEFTSVVHAFLHYGFPDEFE